MTEPKKNNANAIGNLSRRLGKKKLSRSSSPMNKKFTAITLAMSQEKKNCQDRWDGGGQNRKPGNLIVKINNTP